MRRIARIGKDGRVKVAQLDVEILGQEHVFLLNVGMYATFAMQKDDRLSHLYSPVEPLLQINALAMLSGIEREVVGKQLEKHQKAWGIHAVASRLSCKALMVVSLLANPCAVQIIVIWALDEEGGSRHISQLWQFGRRHSRPWLSQGQSRGFCFGEDAAGTSGFVLPLVC